MYSTGRPVGSKNLNRLADLAIDAERAEEVIIDLAKKDVDLSNL